MSGHEKRLVGRSDKCNELKETAVPNENVVKESITDDQQAVRYEPRFRTFSGGNDEFLPSQSGRGVSEFSLEDKEQGLIHTANGERELDTKQYKPRLSYLIGLKAATKDAHSAEETERLQSVFSIQYMMQKAKELMGATPNLKGVKSTDHAVLIATNPNYKSDAGNVNQAPADADRPKDFVSGVIWDAAKKFGVPAAEALKRRWEQYAKSTGQIHPVSSVGKGVLETCKLVMDDRRRSEGGEFHVAFGRKSEGLSASSQWYTTVPETKPNESERHFSADVLEMQTKLFSVEATIHTHPGRKNFAEFSEEDIFQADELVALNPNYRSFLLTPPPHNQLLMYSPEMHIKSHAEAVAAGRIQEIGHFDAEGRFHPNRKSNLQTLQNLGFIQ